MLVIVWAIHMLVQAMKSTMIGPSVVSVAYYTWVVDYS